MSKLEEFRKANPQYKILTLDDPSFKEYGVLYTNDFNLDDVYKVMEKVPIPETGMKYIANIPELADTYTMLAVKRDILVKFQLMLVLHWVTQIHLLHLNITNVQK